MMFDPQLVQLLAKLSRLGLTEKEAEHFSGQLDAIFANIDVIKKANVDDVKETTQVTGLENVMEADEVMASQASGADLLECSPLPIDSKQIRVKRVV